MAQRTTVMNVDVDTDDEVNLIKDVRARSNACYKCGKGDISKEIVSMMAINQQIVGKNKMDPLTHMIHSGKVDD